ncbi:MAG: hypothetical protein ACK5KL_13055 [Dysgonomonas sp.]
MNEYNLIDKVNTGTIIDYWSNGNIGCFKDVDNTCQYRFIKCHLNENGIVCSDMNIHNDDAVRELPIMVCGFVGWLIKKWNNDTTVIYDGYLQAKLNQYKERHKNDADIPFRDLAREFYESHKNIEIESQWIKQSAGIYEYITNDEVIKIQNHISNYLKYLDLKYDSLYPSVKTSTAKQKQCFEDFFISTDSYNSTIEWLKSNKKLNSVGVFTIGQNEFVELIYALHYKCYLNKKPNSTQIIDFMKELNIAPLTSQQINNIKRKHKDTNFNEKLSGSSFYMIVPFSPLS